MNQGIEQYLQETSLNFNIFQFEILLRSTTAENVTRLLRVWVQIQKLGVSSLKEDGVPEANLHRLCGK